MGSTLPVSILGKMSKKWNINKIYILSDKDLKSYLHLKNISNLDIKIKLLNQGWLQFFSFLIILLKVKLSNKRIFFFHECCCPSFDLLVGIIKPYGYYLPQVIMVDPLIKIDYPSLFVLVLISLEKFLQVLFVIVCILLLV